MTIGAIRHFAFLQYRCHLAVPWLIVNQLVVQRTGAMVWLNIAIILRLKVTPVPASIGLILLTVGVILSVVS